jgi:hypothetical protein
MRTDSAVQRWRVPPGKAPPAPACVRPTMRRMKTVTASARIPNVTHACDEDALAWISHRQISPAVAIPVPTPANTMLFRNGL